MTKRIICILMMLIFVSQGCFAQDVFFGKAKTVEYIPISGGLFEEMQGILIEEDELSISFFNNLSFEEYILQAVTESEEFPEEITGLGQYNLTTEEFTKAYRNVAMRHPEAFITPSCTYYYNSSGIVTKVEPEYVLENKAEMESAIFQMNDAIKEYTDLAAKYDTELEKLLVIHDKMVAECDYDVNVLNEATESLAERSVYHAFGALCKSKKKAVCQGYSQALYMIANKIGIEIDFCRSAERKHMWNYVKLDGKWYHMDMTNDDPLIKDENGLVSARKDPRAKHSYFLVSDSGLEKNIHGTDYGTIFGERYDCGDKRYESDHLFNMNLVFTAEKDENGYYTVVMENVAGPLGTGIDIPFKSSSLYTGPVVTYPFVTETPIDVTENNELIIKPCLYLAQYATKNIPPVIPFIKTKEWIKAYSLQDDFIKDSCYMIGIARDIENNPIPKFTSFIFEDGTLCPYALKKNWVCDNEGSCREFQ